MDVQRASQEYDLFCQNHGYVADDDFKLQLVHCGSYSNHAWKAYKQDQRIRAGLEIVENESRRSRRGGRQI